MKKELIKSGLRLLALALLVTAMPFAALAASDGDIKSSVQSYLNPYKDVTVSVDDGIVTLGGTVSSIQERDRVTKMARETSGVVMVKDEIRVTHGDSTQTAGEYLDDAAVTAKVKAEFLSVKGLDSGKISVETNNGVVMLTGNVNDEAQVSLAEQVADQIKGVKRVDNRLSVLPK